MRFSALVLLLLAAPVSAEGESAQVQVAAALARIQRLESQVNAVIALSPAALAEARALDRSRKARGPLHGLPLLVKDNIAVRGLATTAGSHVLAGNVAAADAPLVGRLRAAGAVIVGTTNLSEWANFRSEYSISGWSTVGGQTRNPWALDRNPCGSSSGSGAAVAGGMVTAAIGTETDGSIVCPASVMGIVGMKPTLGLVSRTGIVPLAESQDTAGPMTADVRTAARLLAAMAGRDARDPATAEADRRRIDYVAALQPEALKGARIGVMRFATSGSEAVGPLFEAALETLRRAGAVLVEIEKGPDRSAIGENEFLVLKAEFRTGLDRYLAAAPPAVRARSLADVVAENRANPQALSLFGQDLLLASLEGPPAGSEAHAKARATAFKASDGWLHETLAQNKLDALVAPTTPQAWKTDTVNGDTPARFPGVSTIAAVAGTPHLTVPMGVARGLPAGISFLGARWADAKILALGAAFEAARGPLPSAPLVATLER